MATSFSTSLQVDVLNAFLHDEGGKPMGLPYSVFEKITNNFAVPIDDGRFSMSSVFYEGTLPGGGLVVVKQLNEIDDNAFKREIKCLEMVKDINVARFLGYCEESGVVKPKNRANMLLCFEYAPKSLHDYIQQDLSTEVKWTELYQIIKGICAGLHYLHDKNMMHFDLKPKNILLYEMGDGSIVPKITDFGLARSFKEDKTHITATKIARTELYSLGAVITEIMTGEKGHQNINHVLDRWVDIIPDGSTEWEQIKVCVNIANDCIQSDVSKRPSSMIAVMGRLGAIMDRPLAVQPSELHFPVKRNEITHCPLHLTNNTDEQVAFALEFMKNYGEEEHRLGENRQPKHFAVQVPLYGLLPPRSTYTLIVGTKYKYIKPERNVITMTLRSSRFLGGQDSDAFHSQPEDFFNKAREMKEVFYDILKAYYNPQQARITSPKQISPRFKIILKDPTYKSQYSLDANYTKQWIVVGEEYGHIRIWNYQTQRKVASLKISKERVTCVKFIARKQWLVAGTENGYVHVYNCEKQLNKITSFRAADNHIVSLEVHPTCPYLLLAYAREMKLLDWDKNWKCIHTFEQEHENIICQLAFNMKNTIASASSDHTMKVWSLDSPKSSCTLSGHSNKVNCLHFFTCDDQEYLVTGSDDCTAKIWDMQNKTCEDTLEVLGSPVMCVLYQANLHILITGSKDGCVYLWRSTNSGKISHAHRLERTINIGYPGAIHRITCLLGGSIAIGKQDAVAIVDINNASDRHEESTDFSGPYLNAEREDPTCYSIETEDATSKATTWSSGELLDIHPHRILLTDHSDLGTVPCFLRLTNKTDENVAFRLNCWNGRANDNLPIESLYGIVPPRLSYTFAVIRITMKDRYFTPVQMQSCTLTDKYMVPFKDESECNDFFREEKEMGNVHELGLPEVRREEDMWSRMEIIARMKTKIPAKMKIKSVHLRYEIDLKSLDAHPTEPWIISCDYDGNFHKWNYDDSKCIYHARKGITGHRRWKGINGMKIYPFSIPETSTSALITCIKIIPRRKWIIVGTDDGFLHVYNCARLKQMNKITSFRDHDNSDGITSTSLAVHPTQPYVFSTSLKLWKWEENWKWEKKWKCTQTLSHVGPIRLVEFNPEDPNSFVTVPHGYHPIVQVWSLDSPDLNCTLAGHSEKVNCLAFIRQGDKQYLVTGSDDGTAKVWDLQIKACIHTLEAFMCPITCVTSLPGPRPYLLTGSQNGSVYVWRTTDFRLQRIVHYSMGGPLIGLVCLMASRRVVIGQKNAMSIMDIDEEESEAGEGISNMDTDSEGAVATVGANSKNSDLISYNSWLPGIFVGLVFVSQLAAWYSR